MVRTRTATSTHTRSGLLKLQLLAIATRYNPAKFTELAALIDRLVEDRLVVRLAVIGLNAEGEKEWELSNRVDWEKHDELIQETARIRLPRDWNGDTTCPELKKAFQVFDAECEKRGLRFVVQFTLKKGTDLASLGLKRAPKRQWAAPSTARNVRVRGLEESTIGVEYTEVDD